MTLKIFGLTQKSNLQPIKLLQKKWRAEQLVLNQPPTLIQIKIKYFTFLTKLHELKLKFTGFT